VIKLVPYYALGGFSAATIDQALLLVLPAIVGVFAGVQVVRRVPQKLFFQGVIWALLLMSVALIWTGGAAFLA